MKKVAKKHDVFKNIQFNTTVVRASWIEEKKKWELELSQPSVNKKNEVKYFDFM
jgi:cation diffusion facilitator CzcD-associated flavoprotein CzcO